MAGVVAYSVLAGTATLLGSLVVLALGSPGEEVLALLLGVAGGVMLAVVGLDLLPSAFYYGGVLNLLAGFFLGLALLWLLALILDAGPAPRHPGRKGLSFLRLGYLTALGIALHDLPEGMAIAAGYAAAEQVGGAIALAIGLHNVPEGMATTTPLRMGGLRPAHILGLNTLLSAFTPLGAFLGLAIIGQSGRLLAAFLALAAGAMFYLAGCRLLPESRRHHPGFALFGVLLGGLGFGLLNLL